MYNIIDIFIYISIYYICICCQSLLQKLQTPMLVVFHPLFYKKKTCEQIQIQFVVRQEIRVCVCLQPIFWDLKRCNDM
jgi:hypothetical protein